jgi:hypothetical protein
VIGLAIAAAVSAGLPVDLVRAGEEKKFERWFIKDIRKDIEKQTGARCGASQLTPTEIATEGPPEVFLPPQLAADVTSALYRLNVRATGCGQVGAYNFLLMRIRPSDAWVSLPLLPGQSLTSARLQRDVKLSAFQARSIGLTCDFNEMERTLQLGEVSVVSNRPGEQWVERWPATMCGKDRTVEVTFTSNISIGGTDFAVRPAWTD